MATPAPAAATKPSEFQSILLKIANGLKNTENVIVNVGEAEKPLLQAILPIGISTPLFSILDHLAGQLSTVEVADAATEASSESTAAKIAAIVARNSGMYLQTLASAGISLGTMTMTEFITGLSVIGNLNFSTVNQAPTAPIATS